MTSPHEAVYLRFRGRTKKLPLIAIATVLRRSIDGAAQALELLILGPPETRAEHGSHPDILSAAPHGEGDIGGGVSEQTPQEQTQMNLSCEQKQEHGDGGVGEGPNDARIVEILIAQLGSDANRVAIERLVAAHPASLLHEALRRALAVPPERIRSSRSAIFTGIVRRLRSNDAS